MEQIEIKKSLEKTKAVIIFTIVFIILSIPTLVTKLSSTKLTLFITALLLVVGLLFKRIIRLNHKINSLIK